MIEARRLLGQFHGGGDHLLVGLGGEDLAVVHDVGVFDPVGALLFDREIEQPGLRAIHEGTGFGERRFGGVARAEAKEENGEKS